MLISTGELFGAPVMSLQTGSEVAETATCIIDPKTFHIVAYELEGSKLDVHPAFVKIEDLRELSDIGFIIDSSDEVISLDDIVVAKELYEQPLVLEGMKVVDTDTNKLGKVEQAIMDTDSFQIEQLHVKRPFLKSLSDTNLIINRSQIVDVRDDTIVVQSAKVKAEQHEKLEKQSLINPFRHAAPPQPESVKSDRR